MNLITDREVTSGIMGQYAMRVHIDLHACYLVVGSSYPGCAEASKGGGVNSLKRIVSWVKTVARQVGF
jgi:hypothetical protein